MEIGENIRNIRTKNGLTMKQLAEILGYSESTIQKWEKGINIPSTTQLFSLSEALKCHVGQLDDRIHKCLKDEGKEDIDSISMCLVPDEVDFDSSSENVKNIYDYIKDEWRLYDNDLEYTDQDLHYLNVVHCIMEEINPYIKYLEKNILEIYHSSFVDDIKETIESNLDKKEFNIDIFSKGHPIQIYAELIRFRKNKLTHTPHYLKMKKIVSTGI